jgi:hypothetical protein
MGLVYPDRRLMREYSRPAGECQCTKSLRSSPLRGATGERSVAS